jgi:hypothetical protein
MNLSERSGDKELFSEEQSSKENNGIIYKNNSEKYTYIKIKDIVNKSMEKLKNHLLQINKDIKNNMTDEYNKYNITIITKKYNEYHKDKKIQNNIIESISNIFNKSYKNKFI